MPTMNLRDLANQKIAEGLAKLGQRDPQKAAELRSQWEQQQRGASPAPASSAGVSREFVDVLLARCAAAMEEAKAARADVVELRATVNELLGAVNKHTEVVEQIRRDLGEA